VYGGVRCRVWEGYSDMNQTVENPQPKPNQKRDATSIFGVFPFSFLFTWPRREFIQVDTHKRAN
jgi:hypothetical protein